MKRIYLDNLNDPGLITKGSAVTLGVFDGMHQGHLSVLNLTIETGRRLSASKVVVTFSQHPENILNGGPPKMILSLEHRLRLMARAGIDKAVIVPFNEETRSIPAESFLNDFLINSLNVRAIILGHDTAFGRKREGDYDFLAARAGQYGYEVLKTPEVRFRDRTISSTRIREAIAGGHLQIVEEMLGRELSILGEVVPGDARGRTIGFPTANIDCPGAVLPPSGVYAVKILHKSIKRRAVMNIGTRPTFYDNQEHAVSTVEVHIPNFNEDLYGQRLEVFIMNKIRDEEKFNSVDELIEAIKRDIASIED